MDFSIGSIEVAGRPLPSASEPKALWDGLHPGTSLLPKGHMKAPGRRAFSADTVYERDVEITLRDGHVLRADVFRSPDNNPVPALLVWSPYGKTGTGHFSISLAQGRVGIPESQTSDYESFEAPDPAEWIPRGYAIVNVNARGILGSTGNARWFGAAEGQDGYDAIEYVGKLKWCNGKVALVGNSWLAMSQWHIAAQHPPHLACIAPLEGCSDFYRESLCRGGVPYTAFWGFLANNALYGVNEQEDVVAMLDRYQLMNDYWEDKRAPIERIEVPAYVLASYSTCLHTVGSFRGYEDIPHDKKWLRVHTTHEWHDLYQTKTMDDLQKFFDRYMKGIENSWESTPRVRISTLRYSAPPEEYHDFADWPIPDTHYKTLFLDSANKLVEEEPKQDAKLSYKSDVPAEQVDADSEELSFEYTFPEMTRMIGHSRATLYMSCAESDDLDVFVQLRKADSSGKLLQNINIPLVDLKLEAHQVELTNPLVYLGPSGILRASHRAVDLSRSKPHWALHSHTKMDLLSPGEIVKLEIDIWPTGIRFEAGEKLILKIAGHPMTLAEFVPLRGQYRPSNHGFHNVFVGSNYKSSLIIPIINKE